MSRPWGPGRPRGGGVKVIKPARAPKTGGGGGKKTGGCLAIAVPALTLLAACSLLAEGVTR